jgi:hypothetical protein
MSANEPSLPTLHTLPGLDAKRHFVEDSTLADVQVIKRIVDDHRSDSPAVAIDPGFVSVVTGEEPIVTRKELWSYYCELLSTSKFGKPNGTGSIL